MNDKKNQICCISDCIADKNDPSFQFPKNIIIGKKWLEAISSDEFNNVPYAHLTKSKYRVCYRHFLPDCYRASQTGARILKSGFVPCRNFPPKSEIQPTVQFAIEPAIEPAIQTTIQAATQPRTQPTVRPAIRTYGKSPRVLLSQLYHT